MNRSIFLNLFFFTLTSIAVADPMPVTFGTNPYIVIPYDLSQSKDHISIIKEDLKINIKLNEMHVHPSIILKNYGPPTELDFGFPCSKNPYTGMTASLIGLDCKTKIKIKKNGKEQKVVKKKGTDMEDFFSWHMNFKEDEEIKLDIDYISKYKNDRYKIPFFGTFMFYYRLSTASFFKDPIKELNIDVSIPVETIAFISPDGYKREKGRIYWNLKNYRPNEEIIIMPSMMHSGTYLKIFKSKNKELLQELANNLKKDGERVYAFIMKLYQNIERSGVMRQPFEKQKFLQCIEESARMIVP